MFSERINIKIFQEPLLLDLWGRFPSLKSFHPTTRNSSESYWPNDPKFDQTTIENQKVQDWNSQNWKVKDLNCFNHDNQAQVWTSVRTTKYLK